jgi:hypothetical protein
MPESAEHGETEDSGMEFENVPFSFRELVDMIISDGLTNSSCYPAKGDIFEWLSNDGREDYRTAETETISIHYSRDNKPRSAKYWRMAFVVAGVIKVNKS